MATGPRYDLRVVTQYARLDPIGDLQGENHINAFLVGGFSYGQVRIVAAGKAWLVAGAQDPGIS